MMTRRQAIKKTALISAAAAVSALSKANAAQATATATATATTTVAPTGPFTLPALPYAFDALEPHIDAQTMQIHHDRHHGTYVTNLNRAVADQPDLAKKSIEDLLRGLASVPEGIRATVRNSGGGHYNHSLFWQMLKKNEGGQPGGELAKAIDAKFKSFSAFKDEFTGAATRVFGSGWAWLVLDGKELKIESAPNQDNPLSQGRQVLLGIDVWEHAYYLKYQNRRAEYITAFYNVINWDFVAERYTKLNG